jgi:hypothetical protein
VVRAQVVEKRRDERPSVVFWVDFHSHERREKEKQRLLRLRGEPVQGQAYNADMCDTADRQSM